MIFKSIFPFFLGILFFFVISVNAQTVIPSYYSHSDFLQASPGALENGLLGYVNPAMVNTLHGFDGFLYLSDLDGTLLSPKRWGLFTAFPHVGFGFIRHTFPVFEGCMVKDITVTDYRLSIGGGNDFWSFGLGYGWSRGDVEQIFRDQLWSVGTLVRPNRFMSIGLSGHFAAHYKQSEGLFDLGFRPLGTDHLTLFGDMAWQLKEYEGVRWSAGAVIRPFPGIYLTGRFVESKMWTIGIRMNISRSGLCFQNHMNEKHQSQYRSMGVRFGAFRENIGDTYGKRNQYILKLNCHGKLSYRRYRLFDQETITLSGLIQTLKEAKDDPRVSGIAINLSGFRVNREQAWEIREKCKDIQNSGKKIYIFIDRCRMTLYHLASVADRIVLDPEGWIAMEGFVSGSLYLKGALDKLGLGFEEWRFFSYKSAAEGFSRESMSDKDREQRLALIEDFYQQVCTDVCATRRLTEIRFDSLVNKETFFLADPALKAGLVDTIGRWSDLEKLTEQWERQTKRPINPKNLAGQIFPPRNWGPIPRVSVVYASGICDVERGIQARKLEKIIDKLSNNSKIKALVIRVDSPGGDGLASDWVSEAVKRCREKKPVVVSMGSVAASGGYWLSMNADTIVAGPNTVTGSIGVIGGWIWDKGFGERLGIATDHVQKGDHADLLFGLSLPFTSIRLPHRNLTKNEWDAMERVIRTYYRGFVEKVANARHMDFQDVERISQGRVWSGTAGKMAGLVDVIGGLDTAIQIAKEKAGIPKNQDIELVELPSKGWVNPKVFKRKIFGIEHQETKSNPLNDFLRMVIAYPGQPLALLPSDWIDLE
jgi:protease-4